MSTSNPCQPVPCSQFMLPPMVDTAKYLAVYDINGLQQVLNIPATRGLLAWDGTNINWMDGSGGEPLILDKLEQTLGGSHPFLLIQRPSGQLMAFSTPATMKGKARLISDGGNIQFEEVSEAGNQLPDEGTGVIALDKNNNVIVVGSLTAEGLYYIDGDGNVTLLNNGTAGQVLSMVNGTPTFSDPSQGSAAGGFPGSGLRAVLGRSTSNVNANFKTSGLALKSSVDGSITTLGSADVNVNVGVSGLGGIDIGSASNSTWYYAWVVNNGSLTNAMLSLSATAPDITANPTYTLSAFVGMVYIESTGNIRQFIQKGTSFSTLPQLFGNNISVTTAWALVPGTVPIATLIPPNAISISGEAGGSTAEDTPSSIVMAGEATGIGEQVVTDGLPLSTTSFNGAPFNNFKCDYGTFNRLLLDTTAGIYWKANINRTSKRRVTVTGFEIRG